MSITEYTAGTRLSCHNQASGATIATVATIGRAIRNGRGSAGWAATGMASHHTEAAVRASGCSTAAAAAARSRRPA